MALLKVDGAFPYYWWQITDTDEDLYDGAFPILLAPSSMILDIDTLGHEFMVALDLDTQIGHRFTVPPKLILIRDLSRITRKRLR